MKKPIRKISIPSKSSKKAVPVTKVKAKAKAEPIVVPVAKAATVQAPARKPREPKVSRITHGVTSLYTGDSPGLNKRKSVTVLDLQLFNTKPDYVLKDRSELIAETVKREYGAKPFTRGNIDAGVLKHLIQKGHVQAVSGNGGEDTVLRFTPAGMAHRRSV